MSCTRQNIFHGIYLILYLYSKLITHNSPFFFVQTVFSAETTTPVVPAGTWTHISCTYTATGGKSEIYVNGVLKKQELTGSGILSQVNISCNCKCSGVKTIGEDDTYLYTARKYWKLARMIPQIDHQMENHK